MCRSVHCPSHTQIHFNGDIRDPFTDTDFDFDGLLPIREKKKISVTAHDKKTMPVAKTRSIKHRTSNLKLEDIPEETELHVDIDDTHHADANPELEEACNHLEMDLQVLRRSLDMGVWVLCVGLGFMVSTKFRPRPKFSSLLSSSSFL